MLGCPPDGDIYELVDTYEHYTKAVELFPLKGNPEKFMEDSGWIKISGGSCIFMKVSQAQVNALYGKVDENEYKMLLYAVEE